MVQRPPSPRPQQELKIKGTVLQNAELLFNRRLWMIIDLVCIATDYYLELIQLLHLGVMGQIFTHANLQ